MGGEKPGFLGPTLRDADSVGLGWTQVPAFPQARQVILTQRHLRSAGMVRDLSENCLQYNGGDFN